ncbi:MAG TPA: 16S rRNA (cytidine(1402)-2'-O)-methyltransferase [Trueperaceae bacterium]|nr:16S rRNA (cytidine(1402)-2'-O)-methyltransferase [Trueperaceae bacterium]
MTKRVTLVPTPIGNLGDITARAVQVLREADHLAAEDTRRSRVLLDHLGIHAPLERLDAHTMSQRAPALLAQYEWIAYLTDAGTPGISDPGADLVRLAIDAGATVEVLPGPTAFVPALVASGLPTARFTFEGFLPRSGSARKRRLREIATTTATSIIYESPTRLVSTLADLAKTCGPARPASVSREISKLYEETRRGSVEELHAHYSAGTVKGEIVIVVGPDPAEQGGPAEQGELLTTSWSVDDLATRLVGAGVRGRLLRDALIALGAQRNAAYKLALAHPQAAMDD